MKEEIKKLKKIELHIHLDGSMAINLASTLSGLSIKEGKAHDVILKDLQTDQ